MSIRPFRDINRKKTNTITVGNLKIGGDNPISVQSMTNTLTQDTKSTVQQIKQLENAGADLVRVSCPDKESTEALKQIVKDIQIPLVADIIFIIKEQLKLQKWTDCLELIREHMGDL